MSGRFVTPAGKKTAIEVIKAHIPDLTDDDEGEIIDNISGDVANLAIRTCACGKPIDGFYEYTDHLIEMMKLAGH